MANRLESHVIKRALPDATTFRENRSPREYNNAIAFMNRWVDMYERHEKRNQTVDDAENVQEGVGESTHDGGEQQPAGFTRLRAAEALFTNLGTSTRLLRPLALGAIGVLDKVTLRAYPVIRGREVIEGLTEQYEDLLRNQSGKTQPNLDADNQRAASYKYESPDSATRDKPITPGRTKGKRKKERAQQQEKRRQQGKGRSSSSSSQELKRAFSRQSVEGKQEPTSPLVSLSDSDTKNDSPQITTREVRPKQAKEVILKKEKDPFQVGLDALVVQQREKVASLDSTLFKDDPQQVLEAYKASLTHPYVMKRIGASLKDFPHREAVLSVLDEIFYKDTMYFMNFANREDGAMYLLPDLTDQLFKDVLFAGQEWEKDPFGFKKIGGKTPSDTVKIVFTPEGNAKISEGVHIVPKLHRIDEVKVRRNVRDFEAVSNDFRSVFNPEAGLDIFVGNQTARSTQPQQLEEGKEITLVRPNDDLSGNDIRNLSESVFKNVLPEGIYPLHLVWRNAVTAHAPITDSSSLRGKVMDRRSRRGRRF